MTWWQIILGIAVSFWIWRTTRERVVSIYSFLSDRTGQSMALIIAEVTPPALVALAWILWMLLSRAVHVEWWAWLLAGSAFLALYMIVGRILQRVLCGPSPLWGARDGAAFLTLPDPITVHLVDYLPAVVAGVVVLLAMRACT